MAVSTVGGGGNVTVTQSTVQAWTIAPVADVGGNTNSQYFLISSQAAEFYVWNNVNGTGTDPSFVGKVGIPVSYATNASASAIATAIANSLSSNFSSNVKALNSSVVQVATKNTGPILSPTSAGTSFWIISVVQVGLGFKPNIPAAQEIFTAQVQADVNGSTISKGFRYNVPASLGIPNNSYDTFNYVQQSYRFTVTVPSADVSGNTNNKYWGYVPTGAYPNDGVSLFPFNAPPTVYVWNSVGGAGSGQHGNAPLNGGSIYCQVSYANNSSANTIAAAISTAINNNVAVLIAGQNFNQSGGGNFPTSATATVVGNVVTVTVTKTGTGSNQTGDSGYTLNTTQVGLDYNPDHGSIGMGILVTYPINSTAATIAAAIASAINTNKGYGNSQTQLHSLNTYPITGSVTHATATSVGDTVTVTIDTAGSVFPPSGLIENPFASYQLPYILTVTQAGSNIVLGGGPFTVDLFTTPSTPNYVYDVDIFLSPVSILLTNYAAVPTSGIEWAAVDNNLKQISTKAKETFYPAVTPGTGGRVATGGWHTIKCGPNTAVKISGYAYSGTETYSIAYTYVGYQIP